MNSLPRSKHIINKFVEFNQIGTLNLSNQQTKNVSSNQNPKIRVKFKTPTIKNPYALLADNSQQEEVEESRKNEHGELTNNQSGNEQYLIPDTGAAIICVTLNTKLEN